MHDLVVLPGTLLLHHQSSNPRLCSYRNRSPPNGPCYRSLFPLYTPLGSFRQSNYKLMNEKQTCFNGLAVNTVYSMPVSDQLGVQHAGE